MRSALGKSWDTVRSLDWLYDPKTRGLIFQVALVVALIVLGYEIVIYDQDPKLGGFIRTQIPHFRLPESVIDEEVGFITGIGNIDIYASMKGLSVPEFQKTRNAAINYGVAGKET